MTSAPCCCSARSSASPSIRGITRSVITIAGRNVVTFSSASSPSLADSATKPQLLTSCSSPTRAAGSSSTISTRSARRLRVVASTTAVAVAASHANGHSAPQPCHFYILGAQRGRCKLDIKLSHLSRWRTICTLGIMEECMRSATDVCDRRRDRLVMRRSDAAARAQPRRTSWPSAPLGGDAAATAGSRGRRAAAVRPRRTRRRSSARSRFQPARSCRSCSTRRSAPISSRVEQPVRRASARAVVVDGADGAAGRLARRRRGDRRDPIGQGERPRTRRACASTRCRRAARTSATGSHTAAIGRTAPATKKKDALEIGAPAAGGAIIGALVGGKKGAPIGTRPAAAPARRSCCRRAARKCGCRRDRSLTVKLIGAGHVRLVAIDTGS